MSLGLPPNMGSPRSRNWKGRQDMDRALAPGDLNPKTFSPRSRNMNSLMTQLMYHGSPRMMPPTGSGPENIEGHWDSGSGDWRSPGLRLVGHGCPLRICFPCRFWASVEPYCADITSEEVRTLEELLKPPEDEAEHYKVENLSLNRQGRKQKGSEVPQN